MAFHVDIVSIILADGTTDLIEVDYTVDDCVGKGWLSPEGIWLRKEIDVRAYCHVNECPNGPDRIPDPCYGRDQKLKLVQRNGKWMADMGDGLFFR